MISEAVGTRTRTGGGRARWLWALALVLLTSGAAAEEEPRTVAVGPQYKAGGFQAFWLGNGYRELWTTPVPLPVLDLQEFGGGLTPERVLGQMQSVALAMRGADGRSYTFRSLHKHPERSLPEELQDRLPAKLVQDLNSQLHPAAAVILAPLQEAAGVPHTNPRIVVLPDDPALGEFRERFAGDIGTIEEYPLPGSGDVPGFMGATEIISSLTLWDRWLEGPAHHIDSRALLRARVLDLLLDNYDRRRRQWRWMKVPGHELWQALPEDPDMVLLHRDGLMMTFVRPSAPQMMKFSADYPGRLEGPLRNCFEVDRWLLSDLDESAWAEVAKDVQGRLTNDVIENALRQMPSQWYAIDGEETLAALETRRDGLVDYVMRVYRYYAHKVDVHATDQPEVVTLARGADDSMAVKIAVAGETTPWFHRRFPAGETGEVRVYLHGGDDRVTRTGPAGGPITVRVVAGGGLDVVDDSASGGTDVWRDAGQVDVDRGRGTHVHGEIWTNPAPVKDEPGLEPRNFGHWTVGQPAFGFAPDVGLVLGSGFTRTSWGFRKWPEATEQTLRGGVALFGSRTTGKAEYVGSFRKADSGFSLRLHALASGIERVNFFGFGNDSPEETDSTRYRTNENVFLAAPAVQWESGPLLSVRLGAAVRFSQSDTSGPTIVGEEDVYGAGDFTTLALRAGILLDTRGRPGTQVASLEDPSAGGLLQFGQPGPVSGVRLFAFGAYVPEVWDARSGYGWADGVLSGYLGNRRITLALRAGGRRVWGDYPWFDAAFVGGNNNRGFRFGRFAGDSSLYGSAELRLWAGEISTPVALLRLGLMGFGDVGRVWFEGEDANSWHPSGGGGVMLQPEGLAFNFVMTVAASDEGTRFYFAGNYAF